jgi:integrase
MKELRGLSPQTRRGRRATMYELLQWLHEQNKRKKRVCPLWPETAALLAALLKRNPRPYEEPLFINRYGRPLGAGGGRFKLAQYVRASAAEIPTLRSKRVHPHTFRHTAGVELISAGVDLRSSEGSLAA